MVNLFENLHHRLSSGTIGHQLVPGLLLVDGGQESKLGNGPSVQIVAEELRGQQQNTAGVSPRDQLHYLSQLFHFSVEFSDFPKVQSAAIV